MAENKKPNIWDIMGAIGRGLSGAAAGYLDPVGTFKQQQSAMDPMQMMQMKI